MEKVCLKKLQRVLYYLIKVQEGQIYLVEVLKGGWICLLIAQKYLVLEQRLEDFSGETKVQREREMRLC